MPPPIRLAETEAAIAQISKREEKFLCSSSKTKMTPAMGALKAADNPAAAPLEIRYFFSMGGPFCKVPETLPHIRTKLYGRAISSQSKTQAYSKDSSEKFQYHLRKKIQLDLTEQSPLDLRNTAAPDYGVFLHHPSKDKTGKDQDQCPQQSKPEGAAGKKLKYSFPDKISLAQSIPESHYNQTGQKPYSYAFQKEGDFKIVPMLNSKVYFRYITHIQFRFKTNIRYSFKLYNHLTKTGSLLYTGWIFR